MKMPTLILGSRSPRRAALLKVAGYAFEVVAPAFNDPPQPTALASEQTPPQVAERLALAKANSVREHLSRPLEDAVILTADTIVAKRIGERWSLFGQPETADEAGSMLDRLIGDHHVVVTGIALLESRGRRSVSFSDSATVFIPPLNNQKRTQYLASAAWRGKAGGYNVLELEEDWRITVRGDNTTVAGLPMVKLVHHLGEFGIEPDGQ